MSCPFSVARWSLDYSGNDIQLIINYQMDIGKQTTENGKQKTENGKRIQDIESSIRRLALSITVLLIESR